MTNILNNTDKPNVRVTINDTSEVICEQCSGNTFIESVLLRKVSALLTGAEKDAYIPIPVFCCVKCNGVNSEFIPLELKNKIVT
jgi:hypothetical protein